MIVFLITSLIAVVNCLEPKSNNEIKDDPKTIISKYLKKVPDIESRFVLNDDLSRVIDHYFKGKISSLPLYKISLKIDRNPVKIPWTLDTVEKQKMREDKSNEKIDKPTRHYKVARSPVRGSSTKNPDTTIPTRTTIAPPK